MARPLVARRVVPVPRDEVFDFLSDLRNHWQLADRLVKVVKIDETAGERGGTVRLRGPLGLGRTVTTEVTDQRRPDRVAGTASLSGGTRARVSWTLTEPTPRTTEVVLEAVVERVRHSDRLLLALGGRAWLRRRFAVVLATLERRLA